MDGVCVSTTLIEEIKGGRRGAISKVIRDQVTTHRCCRAILSNFSVRAPPQCERKHFLHPAARLYGALVGTEFVWDLCALLRNDEDLGADKCNEYTLCSFVPTHVNPGRDVDKQHP